MKLPHNDRLFEIRFESIGGLGAHAAAQLLAAAAVLRLGLNGTQFSSYGSEKKGSVVRSFVRVGPAKKPIRTSSPVETPDLIVVFHPQLLRSPVTVAGLRADGTLIYNAAAGVVPAELSRLPRRARVARVDATRIAVEENSRPNAALLGTISAMFPFLKSEAVLESLAEEFAHRGDEAVEANARAFWRGAKQYEIIPAAGQAKGDLPVVRAHPVWGYETAPPGGVLPRPGNTVWNDLSVSRTGWLPVLNVEECIHCALCDLVCPDYCLVWETADEAGVPQSARLLGIDYRYCKGCLRCVESCPTGAMKKELETPGLAERLRVPLFPGLIS